MKATEVRILKALDPGESYVEPTFVLVETALGRGRRAPSRRSSTSQATSSTAKRAGKSTTIGQSVPLSHAAALEWAVSFAASRNIPVVYRSRRLGRRLLTPRRRARGAASAVASSSAVEVVARQAQLLLRRLGTIDDGAKRRVLRPVLRVPREVLARDAHARTLAVKLVQAPARARAAFRARRRRTAAASSSPVAR